MDQGPALKELRTGIMKIGLAQRSRVMFPGATEIRNVGWADRSWGPPPGPQETGLSLGLFSLPPSPRLPT